MSLKRAAGLLGCEPQPDTGVFSGITSDSRKIAPGMLFAALSGQNFDGHDYIKQVKDKGAVAALVSRDVNSDLPLLHVADVQLALGTLAAYWRSQCPAKAIGITGSNGKTTVKEMIASILKQNGSVLATEGNFNNELGLPLTLFRLNKLHDYAVLEMGAAKPGDIAYLAGIAKPDVGVITNIGPAHLQGFVDVEGVAHAKGEMFASLPPGGTAVFNSAEPWVGLWQEMNTAATAIFFNGEASGNVHAHHVAGDTLINTPVGDFSLNLHLPGDHNLTNALTATAVCLALDIPLTDIKLGLEAVKPVPGRLSMMRSSAGWTVIDDTYNANPASLYAALQVLASQRGEPWLVLGDMKELGSGSRKMHAELGDAARSLGVKRLFALGDATTATVEAFGDKAIHFGSRESLIETLCAQIRPDVTCLVKGSRSMGMEHVVDAIANGQELLEVNG
jgi:UDP-N-acetylmuramoyl-tripeptide--D-alanyl-D-alanine ligase